jgi:hypothetical protein
MWFYVNADVRTRFEDLHPDFLDLPSCMCNFCDAVLSWKPLMAALFPGGQLSGVP